MAGRPSKYNKKYCQEIIKFFDRKPYKVEYITITRKNGDTEDKPIITPCDIPFLSAFARKIKVNQDTLHEWANKHKEFSEALREAKEIQTEILVHNGLKGNYESRFAIFTLKNVAGWREKTEQETSRLSDEELQKQLQIIKDHYNQNNYTDSPNEYV